MLIINRRNRRKFWSQTSDNMDRWKAEEGRGREKRKIRRKKSRRKKMQMRERVGKSRNIVFPSQWFGAPEGRKVGSLKRQVRSWPDERWKIARRCAAKHISKWKGTKHLSVGPLLEVEMSKKCTPLWREAHFQVKMYKAHQLRTTFGQLRCRKSARRCGAKHISKSKCTKHTILGPLLEVEMSKKCTPLWREAHFQVKMYKAHHSRTTFGSSDVEKVHAVVARSTFPSQNVQNTHMFAPLLEVQMSLRFTTLHYTTLHYTALHYTTLHNTTTTTTLHYTPLHSTTLHHTTLHYTTLHYTPLHYITIRYIALNDTAPQIDQVDQIPVDR